MSDCQCKCHLFDDEECEPCCEAGNLRARVAQVERERDEAISLRDSCLDLNSIVTERAEEADARVERLEGALREIADGATGYADRDLALAEIARAALEGEP